MKRDWKIGDRVELPDVEGRRFAGMEMRQNPRHIGKTGKIIGTTKIAGIKSPIIRLDDASRTIVNGYECWWRPIQ